MAYKAYEENTEFSKQEHKRDQSGGEGPPMLYLKKGITNVRILPPYSKAGKWFRSISEHVVRTGEGWRTYTCPRSAGQECPICDKGTELVERGKAEASEDLAEQGDALRPRRQFLSNVICYSSPDGNHNISKGIMVMKYGVTVKRQLLDLNQDEGGWQKITDEKAGVDLKIQRDGEGFNTKYSVLPQPNRTNIKEKLAEDNIVLDNLNLHDLDKVFPVRSFEDLQGVLSGTEYTPGFPAKQVEKQVEAGFKVVEGTAVELDNLTVLTDTVTAPDLPDPPSSVGGE